MNELESMLNSHPASFVFDKSITSDQYVAIDLSTENINLPKNASVSKFGEYIQNVLSEKNSKIAFGGYKETRNLYSRSDLFESNSDESRNIHIGLDLWIAAGTPVFAALDGIVHSFKNNIGLGNYGPTIILQHSIQNLKFYSLYGHLSADSIEFLKVGAAFSAGQKLGKLGDYSVNGDYAPHLHFQIIKDIENNFGDYPGVCSESKLDFYSNNCPDPNLLLKIS